MPFKIDLPKDILVEMFDQAIQLRERRAKLSANPIIKEAFEKEGVLIASAKQTIEKMQ
jgi:small-conductance mechanosensitive channel